MIEIIHNSFSKLTTLNFKFVGGSIQLGHKFKASLEEKHVICNYNRHKQQLFAIVICRLQLLQSQTTGCKWQFFF